MILIRGQKREWRLDFSYKNYKRYNLRIARKIFGNINSKLLLIILYSMASIDSYYKTVIFSHQIGPAHKNTEIGL